MGIKSIDLNKVIPLMEDDFKSFEWAKEFNEMLKNMTIKEIGFVMEDGYPGDTTDIKGIYKGKEFHYFVNHDTEEEEYDGPEDIKEELSDFLWSGDYITTLLMHIDDLVNEEA